MGAARLSSGLVGSARGAECAASDLWAQLRDRRAGEVDIDVDWGGELTRWRVSVRVELAYEARALAVSP